VIDRWMKASGQTARPALALIGLMVVLASAGPSRADDAPGPRGGKSPVARPVAVRNDATTQRANRPAEPKPIAPIDVLNQNDTARTIQNVALFGLISLAPIGLLMVTAFVRINIVLTLLRQALGSPQVPGNQVVTALALLLTALVMWPMGESIYRKAIQPCVAKEIAPGDAWKIGSAPIRTFMVEQIARYRHEDYLDALYDYAAPTSPGAAPARPDEFPLRVVMPAFLLSELTTALMMGFYIYLPFLVVDLVVASVLAATGLFMLPPALVATPVKLILFVLADGWLLVADMLLASFGGGGR